MNVGESRNFGVVVMTRFTEHYLVECSMCHWRKEYESIHTAEWLAFTHNRNFRKEGCDTKGGVMKTGDSVEVNQVWASQGALKAPLKHWFGGYEFVRMDGDVAIVKHVAGMYAGIEVRYSKDDVRVKEVK